MVLEGLAAPYEEVAVVDGRPTLFQRGAFARSISDGRPIEVWLNHKERANSLGSDARGTLRFGDRHGGLYFWLQVKQAAHVDFVRYMQSQNAFTGVSAQWLTRKGGYRADGVLTIAECELIEISLMTRPQRPAFASTYVKRLS